MSLFLTSLWEEIKFMLKKPGLIILFFIGIPVLTTWFTGAYYHEYVNDVGIAVLDEDNTSLSRKIVKSFDDSERFNVMYYAENREALQELIDEKKVYMGLYLPPHLNDDVMTGKGSSALILTDGTNVVVGNNVYAGAAEIIQTISAGIEMKIIQGKSNLPAFTANNIALSFNFTDRMLYDSKLTYMNYLIYGFIAVFFQQLMMSGMATLMLRNTEETANNHTVIRMAAKIVLATAALMLSASYTILFVHKKFHLIFAGKVGWALLLAALFAVAISCPAILLCSLVKTKIKFSQVAYMLSLPTFLTCGYVWPVDQMPQILVSVVRLVWPLIYFARPFDDLMIKGVPFEAVKGSIISLMLYIAIFLPVSLMAFKKSFGSEACL